MKTTRIFSAFLLFCLFFNAFGQTLKTGTTAGQVLKLNVGPRAIGMGGAFTATANDISAIYWNPAGSSAIAGNEAAFIHSNLYADIKHDFGGIISNIPGFGSVGAFVTVLSMDEMLVRTIEMPEGTGEFFKVGAFVLGLNYSRNLTDNFSIGFNAKYINEYIYNMNATGFAIDVGTLYRIPILNEFRIGANISNFGTKMRLEGRDVLVITPSGAGGGNLINSSLDLDKFDLPLMFRFGVASDIFKQSENRITVGLDAVHPNDHTEYLNIGAEYGWNEILFVRAGCNSLFEENTEKGFTFGAGANYMVADLVGVKFDYAYQAFGRLGSVQYFSLGVKF